MNAAATRWHHLPGRRVKVDRWEQVVSPTGSRHQHCVFSFMLFRLNGPNLVQFFSHLKQKDVNQTEQQKECRMQVFKDSCWDVSQFDTEQQQEVFISILVTLWGKWEAEVYCKVHILKYYNSRWDLWLRSFIATQQLKKLSNYTQVEEFKW